MATFTAELYRRYQASGLSVSQLAERSGIPGIAMWLYGKRSPTLAKVHDLADALGITNEEERQHFYTLALLAHCPEQLEPMFFDLFARINAANKKLEEYDRQVKEIVDAGPSREQLINMSIALKKENDSLKAELAKLKETQSSVIR